MSAWFKSGRLAKQKGKGLLSSYTSSYYDSFSARQPYLSASSSESLPKHLYLFMVDDDQYEARRPKLTQSMEYARLSSFYGSKRPFNVDGTSAPDAHINCSKACVESGFLVINPDIADDIQNFNPQDVLHIFVHGNGSKVSIPNANRHQTSQRFSPLEFFELLEPYINTSTEHPKKIHLVSCYCAGSHERGIALEDSFAMGFAKACYDRALAVEIIGRRELSRQTQDGSIASVYKHSEEQYEQIGTDSTFSFTTNFDEGSIAISRFDPDTSSYEEVESIVQRNGYRPIP